MKTLGYCLDAFITVCVVFASYGITESYWQAALLAWAVLSIHQPRVFDE